MMSNGRTPLDSQLKELGKIVPFIWSRFPGTEHIPSSSLLANAEHLEELTLAGDSYHPPDASAIGDITLSDLASSK